MSLNGLKNLFPDTYTRRARLAPSLLLALPIALAIFAILPEKTLDWESIWAIVIWCGGAKLLWEIGRDKGKKKEPLLFDMWGGKPTTMLLRHRNLNNGTILEHRHNKLQRLLPDIKLPTAEEESANPLKADEIYEACTTFLRNRTRDTEKYPLVFKENCSYGFRRNLWGMKAIGITTTIVGLAIIIIFLTHVIFKKIEPIPINAILCGLINLTLLLLWFFWFKPEWKRTPAVAYEERLMESLETISE